MWRYISITITIRFEITKHTPYCDLVMNHDHNGSIITKVLMSTFKPLYLLTYSRTHLYTNGRTVLCMELDPLIINRTKHFTVTKKVVHYGPILYNIHFREFYLR